MEQEGIDALPAQLPKDTVKTINLAAARIQAFAEATLAAIRPIHVSYERFDTGLNFRPVSRVACYVPSGRFPLTSTALMTAITAKVAGVSKFLSFLPTSPMRFFMPAPLLVSLSFTRLAVRKLVAAATFGIKNN